MRSLHGRVPVRIDLAGGTLDIWPIHLTLPEPAVTVNAALDLPARVSVTPLPGSRVEIASLDREASAAYDDVPAMRADLAHGGSATRLLARAIEAVAEDGGVRLVTAAESPQGAGLGGSSALLACALSTLSRARGAPLEAEAVRRLAQDLETQVVGGPTGYQDYYPPLLGGCLALEGRPGGVVVEPLPVDLARMSRRLRLVYTGVPHQSGLTNWGSMRAYFDGEKATVAALLEIADLARDVRSCLRRGDLDRALSLVVAEGRVRRRMAPGVSTREIEALDEAVRAAGAVGTKVMGAGGGGCVLVVLPEGPEPAGLAKALLAGGGRALPCHLVAEGYRSSEGEGDLVAAGGGRAYGEGDSMTENEASHGVRAVVFDLDDTLYDCLTQCIGPAHREAARAMVEAGAKATVDEVLEARLALAGVEMDVDDAVAATFRSVHPVKVAEAGRRAFYERDPGPLTPFPWVGEVLRRLRTTCRVVLLSMGHPPTQQRKVRSLGLESQFDEILLDDVFGRRGKEEALRAWLTRVGLKPAEVLVVGDRPDAEIAAALRLGIPALRVRGGEFGARPTPPGVPEASDVRAVLSYLGMSPLETPAPRAKAVGGEASEEARG